MKSGGRVVLGVMAGLALALALLVIVEVFSSAVHPFPADFDGNIAEHVRRYPPWILGVAVLAWGGTAGAAAWVASRVGGPLAGSIVALLSAGALIFNLLMLPYAAWFRVAMLIVFPIASLLGIKHGSQR